MMRPQMVGAAGAALMTTETERDGEWHRMGGRAAGALSAVDDA